MKLLILNPYGYGNPDEENHKNKFISYIKTIYDSIVLIWYPSEFIHEPFLHRNFNDEESFEINNITEKNNLLIYFLFGGYDEETYIDLVKNFKRIKILSIPNYYIYDAKYDHEQVLNHDIKEYSPNKNFKNLFMCLNHRPKKHRAMIIDYISKYDLKKHGLISYHHYIDKNTYVYRFGEEQIMKIENDYDLVSKNKSHIYLTSQGFLNIQKNYCPLINVVTETSYNQTNFITEKTTRNLFLEQIFICLGGKNQNLVLKDFGFELYDEVFDYSFDSIDDLEKRTIGLVENINRLKSENMNFIYDKIRNKVLYNKNKVIEMCNFNEFIPNELRELFNFHKDVFTQTKFLPSFIKNIF